MGFVSVERIFEYCRQVAVELFIVNIGGWMLISRTYVSIEPELDQHGDEEVKVPTDWPAQGAIEFDDMSLTYPRTHQPALRNISLSIKVSCFAGESIHAHLSLTHSISINMTLFSREKRWALLDVPGPASPRCWPRYFASPSLPRTALSALTTSPPPVCRCMNYAAALPSSR